MAEGVAREPMVQAAKGPRGWLGKFSLPGLPTQSVKRNGQVEMFPDEEAARVAALEAFFNVYSERVLNTYRKHDYTRMSGAGLAVALAEANLTPTDFAVLYGVPQMRVMLWIHGEQDIPHSANLLVRLLANPDTRSLAQAITKEATDP